MAPFGRVLEQEALNRELFEFLQNSGVSEVVDGIAHGAREVSSEEGRAALKLRTEFRQMHGTSAEAANVAREIMERAPGEVTRGLREFQSYLNQKKAGAGND